MDWSGLALSNSAILKSLSIPSGVIVKLLESKNIGSVETIINSTLSD
jgi:hypothetical protein